MKAFGPEYVPFFMDTMHIGGRCLGISHLRTFALLLSLLLLLMLFIVVVVIIISQMTHSYITVLPVLQTQVSTKSLEERILKVTVYDIDRHKRHKVIGHALYPLKEHDYEGNERVVLMRDLEREITAEVTLIVNLVPSMPSVWIYCNGLDECAFPDLILV